MQCGWREEAVQCEWRERERESADNVGVGLPGARRREPTEPLQTLLLGKGLDDLLPCALSCPLFSV